MNLSIDQSSLFTILRSNLQGYFGTRSDRTLMREGCGVLAEDVVARFGAIFAASSSTVDAFQRTLASTLLARYTRAPSWFEIGRQIAGDSGPTSPSPALSTAVDSIVRYVVQVVSTVVVP